MESLDIIIVFVGVVSLVPVVLRTVVLYHVVLYLICQVCAVLLVVLVLVFLLSGGLCLLWWWCLVVFVAASWEVTETINRDKERPGKRNSQKSPPPPQEIVPKRLSLLVPTGLAGSRLVVVWLVDFVAKAASCLQSIFLRSWLAHQRWTNTCSGIGHIVSVVDFRDGPTTVSESTVSNTELSEFFLALAEFWGQLSEFFSAFYLCAKVNTPTFFFAEVTVLSSETVLSKQYSARFVALFECAQICHVQVSQSPWKNGPFAGEDELSLLRSLRCPSG